MGIERDEISTILISHYHGDHFMGIPQFLLAAIYEDKRRAPLHSAGPSGVEARIAAAGRTLQECDLAEMDAHWNAIKREEKAARAEREPYLAVDGASETTPA